MGYLVHFQVLMPYIPQLLIGLNQTIQLTILAIISGGIISILILSLRVSRFLPLRIIAVTFIEVIRNIPFIVQMLLLEYLYIYYANMLNPLNLPTYNTEFIAGLMAMVLNFSAYSAESIYRSIPVYNKKVGKFQILGEPYKISMFWNFLIPVALKHNYSKLVRQCVIVMLSSSLLSVIGVHELTYQAKYIDYQTLNPVLPYLAAALIYLILAWLLQFLLGRLGKRLFQEENHV
ncbi:ABC transporter permease subunit [Celerinatantimonas diazotrophica]|uniref:Polar amino acid transport system permease protein n=1 Tax=Celerinatantimonas diazotrophica TaxID=412034 RepID=A0A4R1J8B1_9GAMM|nr:ABC transporter permease subunit [Celerinatantimonas diazotrophica]TCK46756.1 polar amino acid transport system permease protein [Celerinatantimonas diazotrophica]CAG9295459.1 Arginine transport system permease protein ArtQ [Celerinatantimonas diazotrophica]